MNTDTQAEPRFDVVIFNYETREICSIAGKDMRRSERHPGDFGENAEKRMATALAHCNENYGTWIVPTGKYKEGDILADED